MEYIRTDKKKKKTQKGKNKKKKIILKYGSYV